jgi:hypothetical protein
MQTEQDRAADQARFAKYASPELVPQSDRDLLAFLESWRFIAPMLLACIALLLARAGVFA